jgi:AP-2 complex subunit alpha
MRPTARCCLRPLTPWVAAAGGRARGQLLSGNSGEYDYNGVTNPWLQVKLLRLLQYYSHEGETSTLASIDRITQTLISKAAFSADLSKTLNAANAVNATVFEAINLAIHVNPDSDVVARYAPTLPPSYCLPR